MTDLLKDENIRLRNAVKELSVLNEIATQISSLNSVDEIITAIIDKCIKHIKVEQAAIMMLDEGQKTDSLKTMIRKVDLDKAGALPMRFNTQLLGWILKTSKPLIVNDLKNDSRFKDCCEELRLINSLIGAPLLTKGKIIGVITAFNKKEDQHFTEDDKRLLTIIASQSAQIIENARLLEEEKALLAVKEELRMASEIQRKLLPIDLPKIDGYEIAGINIPAKEVGGDYYDFIKISDKEYAFCLGDITGKGLPAALLMSNLQATFRGQIKVQKCIKDCVEFSNSLLYHSTEADKFATFFGAILNSESNTITYCNAGHDNPIYLKKDSSVERLDTGGLLLGFLDNNKYEKETIKIDKGELLLVFSDGVTEAMDEKDNEFGEKLLLKHILDNSKASSKDIIEKIVYEIKKHSGKQTQSDDITLLVLKRFE